MKAIPIATFGGSNKQIADKRRLCQWLLPSMFVNFEGSSRVNIVQSLSQSIYFCQILIRHRHSKSSVARHECGYHQSFTKWLRKQSSFLIWANPTLRGKHKLGEHWFVLTINFERPWSMRGTHTHRCNFFTHRITTVAVVNVKLIENLVAFIVSILVAKLRIQTRCLQFTRTVLNPS